MKTFTHYITPIGQTPWVRRIALGLAALLALALISVGVVAAVRFQSSPSPALSTHAAPTTRVGMRHCRVCQDELLGAAQASAAFQPSEATRAQRLFPVRPRVVRSRIFQDEVIGAAQMSLAPLTIPSSTVDQPSDVQFRPGPR